MQAMCTGRQPSCYYT